MTTTPKSLRRLPVGAEVLPEGKGVHFRVWAPKRKRVEVVFDGTNLDSVELKSEDRGYFSGIVPLARAGMRYRYRLDGGNAFPDPASRFQPEGPHGPSEVIDPSTFRWTDAGWKGNPPSKHIIYEMHIGSFTSEGTWAAAEEQLPELQRLGVNLLEVMPVADFPGKFGWGYDGVDLFAPTRLYGRPDDFRRFVDTAHRHEMGVILDVVYNHFGPDGCYLREFSEDYFSKTYKNEWGEPINFDSHNCEAVREFFATNAAYWIDEFHLDGLRLDATQQIFDASEENIQAVIGRRVREAAKGRNTFIVAENEPQDTKLVRPLEKDGYGLDSVWNDDYHHSAMVALTGRAEAYYTDYRGSAQEFISCAKYGYLFQGQRYKWQKARRGTPALDLEPHAFVNFIQNHDQVANSGNGRRAHQLTSPGLFKAMSALTLLSPGIPMLFQGQEFATSKPFHYFADHHPELAELVRAGRLKFFEQFRSLALPEVQASIPVPADPDTFERCRLDFSERQTNAPIYRMYRDLIRLRKDEAVFRDQRRHGMDGAVLGEKAFVFRYFAADGMDRLLVVNFGMDLNLDPAPEPLLAPPLGYLWGLLWSSEDLLYGGGGTAPLDTEENWRIPGEAAVVLSPRTPTEDEMRRDEG